jgi:CRP-like cAMP-binding protein
MSVTTLGLDARIVDRVRAMGAAMELADRQELIREGDLDQRLYLVESGAVEVIKGGQPVKRVTAGDVVGEIAFLDRRARTASVRAAGTARVCAVDRQAMVRALADDPIALMGWIEAIAARMRSRLDPAADDRNLDAVLAALSEEARGHRAVRHRYLEALSQGAVPDLRWALADFGRHYFGYSAHFPRYLTTVIGRLERPEHRASLLHNLTEESGIYGAEEYAELAEHGVRREWIEGIPHPRLFQRFREALGVDDRGLEDDAIEVVCWREMFLSVLASGSPAEAIGALGLGTETVVRDLYQPFVRAIGRLDLDPAATVFFPLHTAVDDHHQATLLDIARHYARTADGRADLAKGMRKALSLRASFWDWMYERAMTPGASGRN